MYINVGKYFYKSYYCSFYYLSLYVDEHTGITPTFQYLKKVLSLIHISKNYFGT